MLSFLWIVILIIVGNSPALAQSPTLRLMSTSKYGRPESAEAQAQGAFWAAWVKWRQTGSLAGAVFGPVLVGPLRTTSPSLGRWGWNWNKKAAEGSLGAVLGWDGPLALWAVQNSRSREQGIQLRGQWRPFAAALSWRRINSIRSTSKFEQTWVDHMKGGFSWKVPLLLWENEINFHLDSEGQKGGLGSSRMTFRWYDQEIRTTISGALGLCLRHSPLWMVKNEWGFPLFYGQSGIQTAFSQNFWDLLAFRWVYSYDVWRFHLRSQVRKTTYSDIKPDSWLVALGFKVSWKDWGLGVEEVFQAMKNGWKLDNKLYAQMNTLSTKGLWKIEMGNILEEKKSQLLASYALGVSWQNRKEDVLLSLKWQRLPRSWKEVPQLVLIDAAHEVVFKMEVNW